MRATGRLARPPDYYRGTLRRQGISMVLRGGEIEPTGAARGGLAGRLDAIRSRAEAGLGEGMPEREAALARGFVLGQDDRIDPVTIEDFRRSGLAHLLAVSGQNVVLLALLAIPLLAALGIPLRARLLWTCALIAAYVPLAGGGPSIQRAGVMGAAGLIATLAGRPASRAYALLLAVAVTLALNPRASGDAGWQLSFAAVAGIFLLGAPIRARLADLLGSGGWRGALCDGAAVTIAATIATAPLMANHFGTVSVASLTANLLVLPAVAPAMWLGMLTAAAAQVPGLPSGAAQRGQLAAARLRRPGRGLVRPPPLDGPRPDPHRTAPGRSSLRAAARHDRAGAARPRATPSAPRAPSPAPGGRPGGRRRHDPPGGALAGRGRSDGGRPSPGA